jgi:zinc transport system ATP-binding protein
VTARDRAADGTRRTTVPVLELRAATIGYGDRAAVRDVDLTVRPGEVVAIVGPNGSGKTTLVRGVLGLARVLRGEVRLFGEPAARLRERHRIGYVPQRHTVGGVVPSTVEEVVASGRLAHRPWYARANARDRLVVAEAIGTVGLGDHRRVPVANLSGGQQRRVLIARALASEPEVLVMDEPTAGVDAESQANLVATLGRLVGSGLTLVIVTHEVRPLQPLLTRVVAMADGRIVGDGPPPGPQPLELDRPEHHPGHDPAHADPARTPPGWLDGHGLGPSGGN